MLTLAEKLSILLYMAPFAALFIGIMYRQAGRDLERGEEE